MSKYLKLLVSVYPKDIACIICDYIDHSFWGGVVQDKILPTLSQEMCELVLYNIDHNDDIIKIAEFLYSFYLKPFWYDGYKDATTNPVFSRVVYDENTSINVVDSGYYFCFTSGNSSIVDLKNMPFEYFENEESWLNRPKGFCEFNREFWLDQKLFMKTISNDYGRLHVRDNELTREHYQPDNIERALFSGLLLLMVYGKL